MVQNKRLTITLIRSLSGRLPKQRNTIDAMGLKKLHHSVSLPDNLAVQGMLKIVRHLVKIAYE